MSMNSSTVRVSNRVTSSVEEHIKEHNGKVRRPLKDLKIDIDKAFEEAGKYDGIEIKSYVNEEDISIILVVHKWNYGILMVLEASVYIYIMLLVSGFPVSFGFSIPAELTNIRDSLAIATSNIKENLKNTKDPESLKDLITKEFDVLYKPFMKELQLPVFAEMDTSKAEQLYGYLEEKPDRPFKINKRRKS